MWQEYFEGINDPRQAGKVKHKLIEIIRALFHDETPFSLKK